WCKPFLFHSWTKGEPRAVGNTQPYAALKRLFDSEMKPRDTFLNLLNAPLLYTVLDREVPDSFFLPVMFYATDSVQDIYLKRIRAFDSDRVPFALLPGNAGMTEVDGMPAPLQSYRLAEHVYRNYVPLGVVDGWETWVSRTRWERARAAVSEVKLPFREVASFFQQSLDASLDADGLSLRAGVGDTQIHHFLDVPKLHFGAVRSHHALRFRYRSTRAGPLQVFFRFSGRDYNEADSSQVAIAAGGNAWQEAWVPVPLQNRGGAALEDIRLDPPNATEMVLRDFELVFGKPFDIRRQSVKMRMLPFVWGNFDSKSAVRNTAVLEEIALPESAVRGFTHLSFPIQPQVDKTSGNYLHLCISLPPPPPPNKAESDTVDRTTGWKKAGKLKVQYGKSPQGTIEFDLVRPLEVGRALLQEYTNGCKDYLVRLSSQWAWMAQPVDQLVLESSVPIRLRAASIRKGD
ncbi:MAG TPA: hypothetical protein VGJ84_15285, partial [Polyangiaceae bacterium]